MEQEEQGSEAGPGVGLQELGGPNLLVDAPGPNEAPKTAVSSVHRDGSYNQRDVQRLLHDLEAKYKARNDAVSAWMVGCIMASVISQTPLAHWLYTRVTIPLLSTAWQGTRGAGALLLQPLRLLVSKPRQLLLEAQWKRRARRQANQYRQQTLLRRQEADVAAHAVLAPGVAGNPAGLDAALVAAATAVALAAAGNNGNTAVAGSSSAGGAAGGPSSSGGAGRGVVLISRPTPPRTVAELQPTSPTRHQSMQDLRNSAGSLSLRLNQLVGPQPTAVQEDEPGTSSLQPSIGPVLPTQAGPSQSTQAGHSAPQQAGSSTSRRSTLDLFSLFGPEATGGRGDTWHEALHREEQHQQHLALPDMLTAPAASSSSNSQETFPRQRRHSVRTRPAAGAGAAPLIPELPPAPSSRSLAEADAGPDMCVSEVMSVASVGSEGGALGTGELEGCDSGCAPSPCAEVEGEVDTDSDAPRFLGLPSCVGSLVMSLLDTEGIRVLRAVCRSLYFEASRYIRCMVVTPSNLETLVAMPLHTVMPHLHTLVFRAAPPTGALPLPSAYAGPHAPLASGQQLGPPLVGLQGGGATHAEGSGPAESALLGSFNATAADTALLMRLIHEVVPHLKHLSRVDVSESPLHGLPPLWAALLEALPGPHTRLIMREHSAWARGAMGLLGTPASLRDATDHYPDLFDALRKANRHMLTSTLIAQQQQAQAQGRSGEDGGVVTDGEVVPGQQLPLRVDLLGITVRRNTAARLPQLCALQCLTSLTLFGKSAAAATHGHRLAGHLASIACLKHLQRLELLSYEDVSDAELAPLTACTRLRHLYLDSLFIKQACGPVFPSLVSLTAARIKFILRPLTTIFPSLTYLRLGVLHSELNKKISSASLSCLAACSSQLTQLCVCPVLWKGQWQVLPTLPGLTRLQLVHCRDPVHLREVLRVVGRSPSLQHLELHAVTAVVPPWPGAVTESDNAAGPAGGVGGAAAAAEIAAAVAAAAAAAEAAGADEDAVAAAVATAAALAEDSAEGPGSVVDTNIYTGLAECSTLRSLVLGESSGRLVRHLVAAELPGLTELVLRRMGSALKLSDLQAAVLALPSLQSLVVEASGDFPASDLLALPTVLARPSLRITWHATAKEPSLLFARDCCQPLPE